GRSICAGVIEDIETAPPDAAFEWTKPVEACPDKAEMVEIAFEEGVPTQLNQNVVNFVDLICRLNQVGGDHGIGRIDHIEDRLVGLKSREVYEAPAATILIQAHKALEGLTLSKSSLEFKRYVEAEYARLAYLGDWFSSHHLDLLAYLKQNQQAVTGSIRLKLFKGNVTLDGRVSPNALYRKNFITYGKDSQFDQTMGIAFSRMAGMESYVQASTQFLNVEKSIRHLVQD
ncbi:MAG: argininosuccinate synthase, partial [Nitrososphaera sp.]|nr:argininosuccinate synthase [Nitrososphaera sp.]